MPSVNVPAGIDWNERFRQVPALELSEVLDGFLVYQAERDRLHYLNPTAAAVLQMCDGSLRAAELAEVVAAAFRLPAVPRREIEDCLRSFLDERLIAPA